METLYRKVAVSERLPKKDGEWFHVFTEESTDICQFNGAFEAENTTVGCEVTHWLEEVPDNEADLRKENEEMKMMLKSVKRFFDNTPHLTEMQKPMVLNKIEELLNK